MKDGDIIWFTTEFRAGFLEDRPSAGFCAMICWPLVTMLNMEGLACESVQTDDIELDDGSTTNHVWIKLADGRALDPTLDQFGAEHPPVYLGQPIKGIHWR